MPFAVSKGSNHAHGRIYIALGANQSYGRSSPLENLNSALSALEDAGVNVVRTSRPWRTPAWPDPSDPPFTNGAAELDTDLGSTQLLTLLHEIETRIGRVRGVRNAPRTLDLDLIDHRGEVRSGESGGPALPHPRAHERAFVLLPLREIAPYWVHPASGASIQALIAAAPQADRAACRPAGGVLCAAQAGLKPQAR
jgi:2-amino-4-hydroxy-6-hydroxymethyldihydropteridine diphosphokinase